MAYGQKPSVPDSLFLSTPESRAQSAKNMGELADIIGERLSQEPQVPLVSLETSRKAIRSWMKASELWKQRALAAEKELVETRARSNENYDYATAWREVAAIYAFGGPPFPAKGTPERDAFSAKFQAIEARKIAARAAGKPELKSPLP